MTRPQHASEPDRSLGWAISFCVVATALASVLVLSGERSEPANRPASSRWAALADPSSARFKLAQLAVVTPSPEIAYARTRDFGPAWQDVDHNGCDTRNDILQRDLEKVVLKPGAGDCVVISGRLVEPYTGADMEFSKSDPAAVQIDHLIPLHAAWILGAWAWDPEERLAFANDPRNLIAVDGPANQLKSDSLADQWRPSNRAIHCVYAINTVEVHDVYHLGVTAAEQRALHQMLEQCR